MAKMPRKAFELVQDEGSLRLKLGLLTGIPGIAEVSALQILSELVLLAPTMTVRQWVAFGGLHPLHQQSGTSLNKP